jgi:regulator of sirC expression with transglutaminase-like and TPR domain
MTEIDGTTFAAELRQAGPALSPGRAGLLLARECAYPGLRPSDYLAQLDDLAAQARGPVLAAGDGLDQALTLSEWLFQRLGFAGNTADYADPRNSYLNQVLERRLGIPITLSVVFLEVARRLDLPAEGVGLPGHFIVSIAGEDAPVYLDPFHGGRELSVDDCADLVRRSAGHDGPFDPQWLAPTPPRDIVARMLNNLRVFYVSVEDWAQAIKICERQYQVQPSVTTHLRDLGLLHYRAGAFRKAEAMFTEYLVRAPDAPDIAAVRDGRDRLLVELGRLN